MERFALIVASVRHSESAHEALRIQDTAAALLRNGWKVDLIVPRTNPVLMASIPSEVTIYTLPNFPFCSVAFYLRAVALAAGGKYQVVHGFDDGAEIAHAVCRTFARNSVYVADYCNPSEAGGKSLRDAAAVIVASDNAMREFRSPPPAARVSVIPDPHTELSADAFTFSEFADAMENIYTYVMRTKARKK